MKPHKISVNYGEEMVQGGWLKNHSKVTEATRKSLGKLKKAAGIKEKVILKLLKEVKIK